MVTKYGRMGSSFRQPPDFPDQPYVAIYELVVPSKAAPSHTWILDEFIAGWKAVAYRFRATADCDTYFRESFGQYGGDPDDPEVTYRQQRAIFDFFINGLSVIESFCYAMFAVGRMLEPQEFPLASEDDRKHIDVKLTLKKYRKHFGSEALTGAISHIVGSPEYCELNQRRNILAHRVQPPRHHYKGGPKDGVTEWFIPERAPFDENITALPRAWLAGSLTDVMRASEVFARKYFAESPLASLPNPQRLE